MSNSVNLLELIGFAIISVYFVTLNIAVR